MWPKILATGIIVLIAIGCGPETAILDEPFPQVFDRVERLYPSPENMDYQELLAIPAYHASAAAPINQLAVEFDEPEQRAKFTITNSDKLFERQTDITIEAVGTGQTQVIISSQDWDYFRLFHESQRDRAYQAARMKEIRGESVSESVGSQRPAR